MHYYQKASKSSFNPTRLYLWHEIIINNCNNNFMIEQLKDVAADVVGFRATGQITKEDFDTVLLPAVNALADRKGDIKYMLILDTDISNLTLGAWFDDIKMGLMHLLQWRKMAIVTDQPGVNKMTDMAAHILPGETKSYTISETEEAKKWLAL